MTTTVTTPSSGITVTKVEFYVYNSATGTVLAGTDTSSPYSINWTPPAAGSYAVYSVMTDSKGNTQQTNSVGITVN